MAMDYLYSELEVEDKNVYTGVNTDTANINVNNIDSTISVAVKKVPHTLTITKDNTVVVFDGNVDRSIDVSSDKVVANADGQMTGVLNTIRINDGIYQIPTSGGGSGEGRTYYAGIGANLSQPTGATYPNTINVKLDSNSLETNANNEVGVKSTILTTLQNKANQSDLDELEEDVEAIDTRLTTAETNITNAQTNITSLQSSKQNVINSDNKLSASLVSDLSTVATTGAYSDLSGTPTNVSSFTNDSNYQNATQVSTSINAYHDSSKQNTLTAGTGITLNANSNISVDTTVIANKDYVNTYVGNYHDSTKQNVINSDNKLNYNLLSNTPTIPVVPTTLSSFTDNLGTSPVHSHSQYAVATDVANTYATQSSLSTGLASKQNVIDNDHQLSYNYISNKPSIPTKTSDITNDSGFITNSVNNLVNYTKTSNLTDGTTIVKKAEQDANGNTISSTYALASNVSTIEGKIPAEATSSNKLADKEFVNSSINSVTAYYITKNAQGDSFATKAELDSTTTFYSGGQVRVPTRNDYCIVLADETKTTQAGLNPTTRYSYQSTWQFQYIVNQTTLTAAQLAAMNSGITSQLVTTYNGKYTKPATGIPLNDLATDIQTSLGKADTAIQSHQDISGKENISNKVTSFSTPTDIQYPSAKLVNDQLATKQATLVSGTNIKSINGNSILGSGNLVINSDVIYDCTYGSTSFADITSAISNGKLPRVRYNNVVYYYVGLNSSKYLFTGTQNDRVYYLNCDNTNIWANGYLDLQEKNLVTNFTDADDTHYPSAKLVSDQLATKQASLPSVVNDRYLHTNSSTGALEWSTVTSGAIYQEGSGIDIDNTTHTISVDTETLTAISNNTSAISTINDKISTSASSTNKLIDKAYVDDALGGKQSTIDSTHKLSADLISDGTTNKLFTSTLKDKLDGIATGAEVNVQSNWTETDTSSDAYIQNKPTIYTVWPGTGMSVETQGTSKIVNLQPATTNAIGGVKVDVVGTFDASTDTYVKIDSTTNKAYVTAGGSMDNYYTKEEIDAMIYQVLNTPI